jgi:hypothetical protein
MWTVLKRCVKFDPLTTSHYLLLLLPMTYPGGLDSIGSGMAPSRRSSHLWHCSFSKSHADKDHRDSGMGNGIPGIFDVYAVNTTFAEWIVV